MACLAYLLCLVSWATPWWTYTEGKKESGIVTLWDIETKDQWGVTHGATIYDYCNGNSHYTHHNDWCGSIKATRIFIILPLFISLVAVVLGILSIECGLNYKFVLGTAGFNGVCALLCFLAIMVSATAVSPGKWKYNGLGAVMAILALVVFISATILCSLDGLMKKRMRVLAAPEKQPTTVLGKIGEAELVEEEIVENAA